MESDNEESPSAVAEGVLRNHHRKAHILGCILCIGTMAYTFGLGAGEDIHIVFPSGVYIAAYL